MDASCPETMARQKAVGVDVAKVVNWGNKNSEQKHEGAKPESQTTPWRAQLVIHRAVIL
jgi:hypothetical protein